MIPQANVPNLMLKEEVVDAVQRGEFHIWSVETIDEGIEVLTGTQAGKRLPDGAFEQGTVHDRVDRRLAELAQKMRAFGRPPDEDGPSIE
jgi:predicted ATP-dependent protease